MFYEKKFELETYSGTALILKDQFAAKYYRVHHYSCALLLSCMIAGSKNPRVMIRRIIWKFNILRFCGFLSVLYNVSKAEIMEK